MRLTSLVVAAAIFLCALPADARRLYRVKLVSQPVKATIYLDSKESGVRGYTPHTLRLSKKQHTIILELAGYKPLTQTINVKRHSTFTFTLEKIPDPAKVSIQPSPADMAPGTVLKIDGKAFGGLPAEVTVKPGRHQFEVTKEGYHPWQQWVDIQAGEKRSMHVSLVSKAPKQGGLLVSANAPKAEVLVDGKLVGGSPALVEGLAVGPHQIEVRAEGYKTSSRSVAVEQGKTARLTVTLDKTAEAAGANEGMLQILCEPANADIYVDGVLRNKCPVKVEKLAEGTHIVEAKLAGHVTAEKQVAVVKGQVATVKMTLAAVAAAPTPATTPVTGATTTTGTTPATGTTTPADTTTATDKPATSDTTTATAKPAGPAPKPGADEGTLELVGAPVGASVYVDTQDKGTIPLPHPLVLKRGQHEVKLMLKGYETSIDFVTIVENPLKLRVNMKNLDGKPVTTDGTPAASTTDADKDTGDDGKDGKDKAAGDEVEEDVDVRGLSSFGAQLVPPKYFTADVSLGYPYMFEGRLTTGVFSMGHLGLDAGIEFRTFGIFTEVGVHVKGRFLNFEPVALALFVATGGGGGPDDRGTFYLNAGLNVSLTFKRLLTFTGRFWLNFYTDRHCPEDPNDGGDDVCFAPPVEIDKVVRDRFTKARFMMSAILEVPITKNIGTFLIVEGAPGQSQRWKYRDAFFAYFAENDPRIYGRLGASFKF